MLRGKEIIESVLGTRDGQWLFTKRASIEDGG